ncbi:MAG: competence protein ComEC, partial [Giesbergeria sp.]
MSVPPPPELPYPPSQHGGAGQSGLHAIPQRGPSRLVPTLLGVVVGSALQIEQPNLWTAAAYAVLGIAACVLGWMGMRWQPARRAHTAPVWWLAVALALAAFALCGLRALHYTATAFSPALEGRDIVVTGTVADLPQ